MEARLVVAKGKTAVKEIPLGEANTVIGRRNDCGLRIPSPLVSRQHCELKCAGSRLVVRDLGSSNGTFVNGAKIKQKELKSGDTLGVGPITFIVQLGGRGTSPSDTSRPVAAAASVGDDAADFVVAEEVEGEQLADFVVGDEAEVVAEESDFVVADEASAGNASDFVVADATDDTEIGEVSDFVVADESAPAADAEFVVADEVAGEGDTVQSNVADLAKRQAKAKPAVADAEPEPAQSEPPKAKQGFFGRLFKKRQKKVAADEPPAAEKPSKASKAAPAAAGAAAAAAVLAAQPATPEAVDAEAPDFFVTEDNEDAATAKPVGEDELADFLMGLNEKEQ